MERKAFKIVMQVFFEGIYGNESILVRERMTINSKVGVSLRPGQN